MGRAPDEPNYGGEDRTRVEPGVPPLAPPSRGGLVPQEYGAGDDEADETKMLDTSALAGGRVELTGHLVCLEGNDGGRVFPLNQDTTLIGRGLSCDIVLNDPSVSRQHCNVILSPDGFKLIDLGSGNGTRVDGATVQEALLAEGTCIELGVTTLRFGAGEARQASAPVREAPAPPPPAPVIPRQPRPPRGPAAPYDPYAEAASDLPPMQVVSPHVDVPHADEEEGGGMSTGLKVGLVVAITLAALAGAFLGGDALFGWGLVFESTPASVADDDPEALFAEARDAMAEEDWGVAIERLERIRRLDPDFAGLRTALRRARDERDAKRDWERAQEELEAGAVAEARKRIVLIPDGSMYYDRAQRALSDLGGPAPTVTDSPAAVVPAALPGGAAPRSPALKLFDAGDFAGAERAFRAEAAAASDSALRSNAQSKAEAVAAFASASKAAERALAAGELSSAIERFRDARTLDETLGGGRGAALSVKLARALVARSEAHLGTGEVVSAAADVFEAARAKPDLPEVAAARAKLAARAPELIARGRALVGESRSAEAKGVFQLVHWLLPEGTPGHAESAGWLKALADQPGGIE